EYQWTGNDYRVASATLARDPAFKTAHAADAMKKAGAQPIKVGKRDAWLLPGRKVGMRQAEKIVVPVADDAALIVEGLGMAHRDFPTELAGRFDRDKVAAALKQPPRTEFGRSLDAFKALKKDLPLAEVAAWVGDADQDIGSGIHVLVYKLPDQSRVLIGFPSF